MDDLTIQQRQEALVDLMKKNGSLKSAIVEQAFLAVPRHFFLPNEPAERAYADIAIAVRKVADNQWTSSSSQPTMMAIMLEQLDLHPGQKVLEIGTGTGFNAALMAEVIGSEGRIVTVDIQPDLIDEARGRLEALGYTWIQPIAGDGGYGYTQEAPYDRIILTVGSETIAPAWRDQLTEGGILVMPLSVGETQKSIAFKRHGDILVSVSISDCGFMMLQGAFAGSEPAKIQLSPDKDTRLYILSSSPLPADAEQIGRWLSALAADLPSGVEVKDFEVWGGLPTWLTTQNLEWCILLAEGDQALRSDLPDLQYMGSGEEFRVRQSYILIDAQGAAAVTRPRDKPAPFMDFNNPVDEEDRPPQPPYELYIRQLGSDPAPANRLLAAVRAWGEKGKPGSDRMTIRAIPAEMAYDPTPGEFVMDKPWTKLILSYK